jgi:hypothetical protein
LAFCLKAILRLTEMLEDLGLSRILKEAKRADAGKPGIHFAEVKRQLAAKRRGKSSSSP